MPETNPNEKQAIEMADKLADALFPQLKPRPVRQNQTGPTPGPWRLKENGDVVTFVDGSEYVICWTDADSALTEEEQIANGHLIAVAPILASIAQELLIAWNKCDPSRLHSIITRAQLALSLMEVQ